jgi:hypothetical protein
VYIVAKSRRPSARMVGKGSDMGGLDLDSREVPFDRIPGGDEDLRAMLNAGPDVISSVKPEPPPMPQSEVAEPTKSEVLATPPSQPGMPDPAVLAELGLPSEKERAALKSRHGELRVVPIPWAGVDGKPQAYILRKLTRGNWTAMRTNAVKLAESKPGRDPDEIFAEKIVEMAVVWPRLGPTWADESSPGLIPTLFGIIQQMGLFFDPAAMMGMTFLL